MILQTISEVRQILAVQEVPAGMVLVWGCSSGLALLALSLAMMIDNLYIAPILMALFAFIPFFFIKMRWSEKERQINNGLESALSSITTSYLRSNNTIIRAVEENLPFLKPPVSQVFKRFIIQTTLIDSDVNEALEGMKETVHNTIFSQWIDVVIQSQRDYNLKVTLPRILDKFSDLRAVNAETEVLMAEPKRTYFIMLLAAFFSPFLLYLLNKEWWNILINTPMGKILLTVHISVIALTLVAGFRAMRPIVGNEGENE
ncbi:MAG: hypothetical protein RR415_07520 [Ruthenibacterium sp.]